jgi:hypothetical protein
MSRQYYVEVVQQKSGKPEEIKVVQPPKEEVEEKSNYVLVRQNGRLVPFKVTEVKKLELPKRREELKEEVEEEVIPAQRRRLFITPTRSEEVSVNEDVNVNYSPTFIEAIRNRVRSVFEPLFSDTSYQEVNVKSKYKPRLALKKKVVFKPKDFYKFFEDYDYEPHLTQIAIEDFAPKDKEVLQYSPQTVQESYPVFTYATYGLPDTYIDQYAPEESVKIKPVTEFEIKARPKPLIISQAHLILLNKLLNEVL